MVSDAQLTPDWRNGFAGRTAAAATTPFLGWKRRGGDLPGEAVPPLSARKLAASLWRLGGGSGMWQCGLSFDRLGFQFCSSLAISKFANEGATKWDYCDWKAWDCGDYFAGQAQLFETRKHVQEREAEGGGSRSRTKLKYGMRKMNEERASSRRAEEQCPRINCKKIDMMNSSMLHGIAEAKSSARKFIWNLDKEKKARRELESACNLASEIEGRKAEKNKRGQCGKWVRLGRRR